MPETLPTASVHSIKAIVDCMVKDAPGIPSLPCGAFHLVDNKGNVLASEAAGTYGLSSDRPLVADDAVFWLASCTKVVTAIACMQLVESGKLRLDDHDHLYSLCPELKAKKVLQEDGTLAERQGDITLRQLLCHTAGFGYTWVDHRLKKWSEPAGVDEFGGHAESILSLPLVSQPGQNKFQYSVSSDWAGVAVERATGMRLDDYFKEHIFRPLGITSTSFYPTQAMKDNLVGMHRREPADKDGVPGKLIQIEHPLSRTIVNGESRKDETFNSGGAGLFGTVSEFADILAVLINGGISPKTSARILQTASVDALFANQLPEQPDFARNQPSTGTAKPWLANGVSELFPQPGNPPQGFTMLAAMLITQGVAGGRADNSIHWLGLANLMWWADRASGVAAVASSSVLPLGELGLFVGLAGCEQKTYEGLNQMRG